MIGAAPALAAALLLTAAPAADDARQARARAWFTEAPVVTQDGKPLRFYTDLLAGRVVVLSFFHADCKNVCPALVQSLNTVRHQLGPLFGSEVTFVSISVDPENDTPERVAQFAKKLRAVHAGWTFVTGKPEDLAVLHERLGRRGATGKEDHAMIFFAGNFRTDHFVKIRRDMPAASVAEQLRQLAGEDAARASGVAPAAAP